MTDVKSFIFVEKDTLYLLKKYEDDYICILKTKAYTGKNGFTDNKKEGDGKTPVGIFPITFAFGLCCKPKTKLRYIKVNKNHYYIDDQNSKHYNRLVNAFRVKKDWSTAEKLNDYPKEYAYSAVIGYNQEGIKDKGSAIFLHCKGKKDYTAGCIAVSRKDMLFILSVIDENSKIIIKA